jgi:hypothetical protein
VFSLVVKPEAKKLKTDIYSRRLPPKIRLLHNQGAYFGKHVPGGMFHPWMKLTLILDNFRSMTKPSLAFLRPALSITEQRGRLEMMLTVADVSEKYQQVSV